MTKRSLEEFDNLAAVYATDTDENTDSIIDSGLLRESTLSDVYFLSPENNKPRGVGLRYFLKTEIINGVKKPTAYASISKFARTFGSSTWNYALTMGKIQKISLTIPELMELFKQSHDILSLLQETQVQEEKRFKFSQLQEEQNEKFNKQKYYKNSKKFKY